MSVIKSPLSTLEVLSCALAYSTHEAASHQNEASHEKRVHGQEQLVVQVLLVGVRALNKQQLDE